MERANWSVKMSAMSVITEKTGIILMQTIPDADLKYEDISLHYF